VVRRHCGHFWATLAGRLASGSGTTRGTDVAELDSRTPRPRETKSRTSYAYLDQIAVEEKISPPQTWMKCLPLVLVPIVTMVWIEND
jgi:hypothetical protein